MDPKEQEASKPEAPKKKEGPIWPIEPEQMEAWKKLRETAEAAAKEFLAQLESPLALDATAESGREAAKRSNVSRAPREAVEAPKEKPAKVKKESKNKQKRLGQTKLIDDLLKAGKSEQEIIAEVRSKIPLYPADKIPQMIKLRRYHVK